MYTQVCTHYSAYTVYTPLCIESYTISAKSLHLVHSSVHQNVYEVYSSILFNSIKKFTELRFSCLLLSEVVALQPALVETLTEVGRTNVCD